MLTVLLLAWSIRMGCATAAPSAPPARASYFDAAKQLRDGAVGVLFDPEQRNQPRNPHSMRDGDDGFFVVVGANGRVRVARVKIGVTYHDNGRNVDYGIGPPRNATSLAWTTGAVGAKTSHRLLTNASGDLTQLGSACFTGSVEVNEPFVGPLPAQPQHALIQIGRRPDIVVFRDIEHSQQLQCDARANELEAAVVSLLGELNLTW